MGASVGAFEGAEVGLSVGSIGLAVGLFVGAFEGPLVGGGVGGTGLAVGDLLGLDEGEDEGAWNRFINMANMCKI